MAQCAFNVEFTVIICSRDRVGMLRDTVKAALERLSMFPNGWLLVVDNASQDGTAAYLAELRASNERVLIAHEPKPGVYYARARALECARGTIFLMLDDDVLPSDNWPTGLIEELLKNPRIGFISTALDPVWEGGRPGWMTDRIAANSFAISAQNGWQQYRFPRYLAGGSCAIRVCDFLQLFRAPERQQITLGWGAESAPGGMVGGEDWDLEELYIRNGFDVVVNNRVCNRHRTNANKLTPAWPLRKFEIDGRTRIRYARLAGYPVFSLRVMMAMAAFPVLWMCDVVIQITGMVGPRSLNLQTYSRSARGFWRECLWGVRGIRFPFRLETINVRAPAD
jgi:glycosyltransferase involved in cell wall biosynthesis